MTDTSELVTGPAQSGLVGDYFMANDRVRFIIQAPGRALGVIPQGGNLIDAVLTDGTAQLVDDHFGELGLIYKLGRTCEPTAIEIIRDGSRGGVAALRAIGRSGNNDFINLKGVGPLRVDREVDPDLSDDVACATTYVLAPGSTTLEVHHSLFNDGDELVQGPLGTIADSGGNTEAWTGAGGFERADISALFSSGTPRPMEYMLYQAPNVAYGVIPRSQTPQPNAHALIAGVSVLLTGNSSLLDVLRKEAWVLQMPPGKGKLQSYDVVVGRYGAQIDEVFRTRRGDSLAPLSGRVRFASGVPASGARVGVFLDGNNNGQLDDADVDLDADGVGDDKIITYLDADSDGAFDGTVTTALQPLLVRAEIKNVGRSTAVPITAAAELTIPSPIVVDYRIVDGATGGTVPGRLLVVGDHPAFPDARVFETYDRLTGIVEQAHAMRGTTEGKGADPQLVLPAGNYRIYASRGTEWTIDSRPITATANVTFTLRHVNPTPGYVASDWHVHQVGSPDANVLSETRIASAISAGVDMFAVTDHDHVSDLQTVVERLGVASLLRVVSGLESTPFAYGHFNAWPIVPDPTSPNGDAVDWARGADSFAMKPSEIYDSLRARGASVVQVNHPRSSGFGEFQAAFSRANVKYDYDGRRIFGDFANASIPYADLRLPDESLWSDKFNGLEVWNGFSIADTNGDGLRENTSLDRGMRDWLSMLSLGFFVTPTGNSDTHTAISDPVGMPRTYVRVPDDSPQALESGAAMNAVIATQTGTNQPRDIVVTNGPMIAVSSGGQPVLGREIQPAGDGSVTVTVTIVSADWAEFDTLELFANTAPDNIGGGGGDSTLVPLRCWTSRAIASLPAGDPCVRASLAPSAMTVDLATVAGPGNARRYEATVMVTIDALDITNRPGATGTDAWLVFRVRGDRAIFPLVPSGAVTVETTAALLGGNFDTIRSALAGKGVPAGAFTTPVFVDFDGGGYRAPFSP